MTTELGPYIGEEVGFPDTQWGPVVEGTFKELPKEEIPSIVEEEPGTPSEKVEKVNWFSRVKEKIVHPKSEGEKAEDRLRKEKERKAKRIEDLKENLEQRQKLTSEIAKRKGEAELEELRAARRKYRREYRPQVGKTIRTWLKPRPDPSLRQFYIPKAMKEYYVPGGRVRALTTPPGQESPIAQVSTPDLVGLRRASSPPPTTAIRAPFKDVERQEGLGPALGRLRQMGKFPKVDWAVYSEIHANGDIDTPSHIKSEVRQLGFTRKEIDDSLSRLRKLGIIAPTGLVMDGEKELMITGDTSGY